MENRVLKNPKLVVAMDIGSTYSGYAWQWREQFMNTPQNIHLNTSWGGGSPQSHKTTTCLLLNEKKEVDSFGYEAEKTYCQKWDKLGQTELYGKWYFFKFFKMVLYRNNFSEESLFDDDLGQQFTLLEVMSKFIGALRSHFLTNLSKKEMKLRPSEIQWVITVPAIWSDSSKRFMRDAAEMCGIEPKNLILALEPEAAAIYCMFLPREEQDAMDNLGSHGDKFLVADLGGCTADVTAVEVVQGTLNEIASGEGARGGGQDVNNAFLQLCRDAFSGSSGWDEYWQNNKSDLFEMEKDFERKKISIGHDTKKSNERISLTIPYKLMKKIDSGEIPFTPVDGIIREEGKFMFESAFIRDKLFDETTEIVVTPLIEVLQKRGTSDIKKVIMVGGFAESAIVREKIQTRLKKRNLIVKLMNPSDPLYAVLKGAVLFGHNPEIFSSRISRYTYGVKVVRPFKQGEHDERKKVQKSSGTFAANIFSIHVAKDQVVKLGERQKGTTYNPVAGKQKAAKISVYSSISPNPKYVDEPGCSHLADIRVDLTDIRCGIDREIQVTMIYGWTELVVEALDVQANKIYDAKVNFQFFQ